MSNAKIIVAFVAVLVIGAAAGLLWGQHRKSEQHKAVVALLAGTGAQLRAGLTATAEGPDALRKLDEQVAAAERNLAALKAMDAGRVPALADAADDYLLTGREVLKRVADVERYRQLLSESVEALVQHMRADNHSGAWVQQAVKARERANKDHRGLKLAADALDQLLQSLPASQKKISPYVEPALLIDEVTIGAARARALEHAQKAAAEIGKTSQLDAFR